MRTARAKISVDIMLVTVPTRIVNTELRPGDFIVSDGVNTWAMSHEEAAERVTFGGTLAKKILEESKKLVEARPKLTQTALA